MTRTLAFRIIPLMILLCGGVGLADAGQAQTTASKDYKWRLTTSGTSQTRATFNLRGEWSCAGDTRTMGYAVQGLAEDVAAVVKSMGKPISARGFRAIPSRTFEIDGTEYSTSGGYQCRGNVEDCNNAQQDQSQFRLYVSGPEAAVREQFLRRVEAEYAKRPNPANGNCPAI